TPCPPRGGHARCPWGSITPRAHPGGGSVCALPPRLRYLVKQLDSGEVNVEELKRNLEYAASLLEAVYIDETRQVLDTEDELREMGSDAAVPSEVRDWLAATFTQQARAKGRRAEEKPKFRSIVHAVQAGIFVERMFRRTYTAVAPTYSTSVLNCLKVPGGHPNIPGGAAGHPWTSLSIPGHSWASQELLGSPGHLWHSWVSLGIPGHDRASQG
ncbi:calcium/calmodulin-dependent 3',5'-cyclic nucleotide phosphodiesterase 1B-like, partial [Neopelma chrysocephalum]|uniref:calcium/calmodulin-dependent 3',5'-cyclic nucleotide phosphodiesterase 1B-like n=1 Tax=Neopelma chrysocephalum TaxID=114329 RepID=UPI000FCD0B34